MIRQVFGQYILQVTTHHITRIFTYQMNDIPLRSVEKVKYLGVHLSKA